MTFLDPQFRITRARSCIYLLLSKFFSRELQGSEVKLALGVLRDSADVLPDYFWTEKTSRADFNDLLQQVERARSEEPAYSSRGLSEKTSQSEKGGNGQRKLSPFDNARITSAFDLLALELEHLHTLTRTESEHIDEKRMEAVNESHRQQVAFLWDHLRAAMLVFDDLSESCPSEMYRLLVRITHLFTEADALYACFVLGRTTDLNTALEATGLSPFKTS